MDDFFDSFTSRPKYDHKVRVVHFKKEPYDIYIGRLPNGKFNKTQNPTYINGDTFISEIALMDSSKNALVMGKLSVPVLRTTNQVFSVSLDF